MRVLFFTENANLRGGTEVLALNLVHKLNEVGIESKLLSTVAYKGTDKDVLSPTDDECRRIADLLKNPLNKILGGILFDRYFSRVIDRFAKEWGAAWVIGHSYDMITSIPLGKNYKVAQIFNWSLVGYEKGYRDHINNKKGISKALSLTSFHVRQFRWHRAILKMNRLIVLTQSANKELLNFIPVVEKKRIVVIPNPVMANTESNVRSSLKNHRVVFVGRLSPEKGVFTLLRIWKRIQTSLPELELDIYGEGPKRAVMDRVISEEHIKHVNFHGYCTDLKNIYSHADMCLMTSYTEGFGMVLIEAMYYGVPCICFDCPVSPKEIVSNAGETVTCYNEEAYAERVVSILKDPERLKVYQKNAQKRASDFYLGIVLKKWKGALV